MEDSHEPNVGNKQQGTQMYTSHATQLVPRLSSGPDCFPSAQGYLLEILLPATFNKHTLGNECSLLIQGTQITLLRENQNKRLSVPASFAPETMETFGLPSLLKTQNTTPSLRHHCFHIKTIYDRLCVSAINDERN